MAPPSTDDDLPDSIDQLWAALPKEDKSIVCNHLINYKGSGIECFFSSAIRLVYDASSSRNAARAIESDGHKTSTSLSTPKLTTREAATNDGGEKMVEDANNSNISQTYLEGEEFCDTVSKASSSSGNANAIPIGAQPPASDPSASPKVSANNGRKPASASVFALDPKPAPSLGCVPPSAAAGVGILGATAACPKPVPFGKTSIFTGGSSPFSTSASVASTDATANNTTFVLGNPLGNPSLPLFSTAPKLSATEKLFGTKSSEIIFPSKATNPPRSGLFGAILGPGQSRMVSTHAPADSSAFGVNEVSVSLDLDKTSQSLFGDSKTSKGGGSAGQVFGQAAPVTDRAGVPTSSGFSGIFGTPSFNDSGSLFGQGLPASGTDKRLANPAFEGSGILPTASSGVAGAGPAETSTSAAALFGPSASGGRCITFSKCSKNADSIPTINPFGFSSPSNFVTGCHKEGSTTDEVVGAKRKVDEVEDAGSTLKKIRTNIEPESVLSEAIDDPATVVSKGREAETPGLCHARAIMPHCRASLTNDSSSGMNTKQSAVPSTSYRIGISVPPKAIVAGSSASATTQRQDDDIFSPSLFGVCRTDYQIFPEYDYDPVSRSSSVITVPGSPPADMENICSTPKQSTAHEAGARLSTCKPKEDLVLDEGENPGSASDFREFSVERKLEKSLRISENQCNDPPDKYEMPRISLLLPYTSTYRPYRIQGERNQREHEPVSEDPIHLRIKNLFAEEPISAGHDSGHIYASVACVSTTQDIPGDDGGGGLSSTQSTQQSVNPTQAAPQGSCGARTPSK